LEVDDSYKELGIPREASDAEVKAAWRRLAAHWHPDRNTSPAALRKIQRINRALEEIRKARRMSPSGADDSAGQAAPAPPTGRGEEPSADGGCEPARTLQHTVSVTLEEACAGCVKEVSGEVVDPCVPCAATGVDPAACACAGCEGTGQVRQALWFGWLSTPAVCADCEGTGESPQACCACAGSGKAPPRRYRARVRIPAGIRQGAELHVPARARRGAVAPCEAIALVVDILPHPFFTLDDDGTVRCEVPVDGFTWIAERWTDVPTPSGLQQMRLRRGHLVYRIKGHGFPVPGTRTRADCLVTVTPLFPQGLDGRQESLIDRLVASNSQDPSTPAGQRMGSWRQSLASWQPGLPGG
jgi:DnaJ-class molecular chaperone